MTHAQHDHRINKDSRDNRRNAGKRVNQKADHARKHAAAKFRKINSGSDPDRYAYDARERKQNGGTDNRVADAAAFADRAGSVKQKTKSKRANPAQRYVRKDHDQYSNREERAKRRQCRHHSANSSSRSISSGEYSHDDSPFSQWEKGRG